MPNRKELDDTLQRVGLGCLLWYPDITAYEPDYELVSGFGWDE